MQAITTRPITSKGLNKFLNTDITVKTIINSSPTVDLIIEIDKDECD